MTRVWARQKLDIDILEKLYDSKALRGKTIAKLLTPEKENRGYDRLHALMKKKLVEGVAYCEYEYNGGKEKSEGKKRKKATLYYLTQTGVAEVKKIRGLEVDGSESSMRPDENQMVPLYFSSLLAEHVPWVFKSQRPQQQLKCYTAERSDL